MVLKYERIYSLVHDTLREQGDFQPAIQRNDKTIPGDLELTDAIVNAEVTGNPDNPILNPELLKALASRHDDFVAFVRLRRDILRK